MTRNNLRIARRPASGLATPIRDSYLRTPPRALGGAFRLRSEVPRCQHIGKADPAKKFGSDPVQNHIDHFRTILRFRTAQWPDGARLPEVYYGPRAAALNRTGAASLHAKCVVVDGEHVFVSSTNFTEAGQTRNIELGMLVSSRGLAERITDFFDQLVEAKYLVRAM